MGVSSSSRYARIKVNIKPKRGILPAVAVLAILVLLFSFAASYGFEERKTGDRKEFRGTGPTPGWSESEVRNPSDHVVINEVYYDGQQSTYITEGDEFIELYNAGPAGQDLSGWIISDGEGTADLPSITLPSGGYLVLASNADDFYAQFGFEPDYEWHPSSGPHSSNVPDLGGSSPTSIALANGGDEVYIATSSSPSVSADAVVWETYNGADLPEGVWSGTVAPTANDGESIERATAGDEGTEADGPDTDTSPENDEDLASTFTVRATPAPVPELSDLGAVLGPVFIMAMYIARRRD